MSATDLEQVLAAMPRMLDITKDRMRKHFVGGVALPELARQEVVSVPSLANVARRVRAAHAMRQASGTLKQSTRPVHVQLKVQSSDLERAFAAMPRISEATRRRVRRHLIDGLSGPDIAADEGISVETLYNAVRRVRLVLAEQPGSWKSVAVQLVMPVVFAQELQRLCTDLMNAKDRDRADKVMKMTLANLSAARAQIKP